MKSLYDIAAPAKLNLFLHVIGRRSDGYHLLESAFMLLDWCDTLHFELRKDGRISREDLSQSLPADDLIVRAASALQPFCATRLGVHIGVDKRIPAQAGMGGGSSDAASTLLALNRLWQLNLPLELLATIGLGLGADVPFFLRGQNAWVSGVGEKTTPVALAPARFVVVKPALGSETKKVFSNLDFKEPDEPTIISRFAANVYDFGRNDLQPVAEKLCPDISQALAWLDSLGLKGRMTGSGSAVFAYLSKDESFIGSASAPLAWQVRVCGNLPAHPLVGWAI